jgi:hypothetical protein
MRSPIRLAALVAAAAAAFVWISGVAHPVAASAATGSCVDYKYCLEFRSQMNNKVLDGIFYHDETQQQAVMNATSKNGLWGISLESYPYWTGDDWNQFGGEGNGVFRLRSLARPNSCLTESLPGRNQARVVQCAAVDNSDDARKQSWFLVQGTGGDYSLRSLYDGKCLDILNGDGSDGAQVGAWDCNGDKGSSNQQWHVADYSGKTQQNSSQGPPIAKSPLPYTLASETEQNLGDQVRALNLASQITFCNHAAYLAEGVVSFARTGDGGTQSDLSTPVIPAGQCKSMTFPKGEWLEADVEMHEFSGMYFGQYGWRYWPNNGGLNQGHEWITEGLANDDLVGVYTVAGKYVNLTFNFYGSVCYSSSTIDYDFLSKRTTVVNDNDLHQGCQDANDPGLLSSVATVSEALEDFTDSLSEFLQWMYEARL